MLMNGEIVIYRVSLPCSGQTTTEVPVTIKFIFNVKQNLTEIAAKRNKICLKKGTYFFEVGGG